MTKPTHKEIIDAYDALDTLCDRVLATRSAKERILKALPPKPQPTMAEIEWDDDKHYLAEAEHPGWGKVIMLGIGEEKLIDVFIPHLRESNCIVPRRKLTPTGKRYISYLCCIFHHLATNHRRTLPPLEMEQATYSTVEVRVLPH